MRQTKTKPAVNDAVLKELRAMIAPASPGRVQRGISWPAWMDEAVNQYLETVNANATDAEKLDRSGLVQLAVVQLLKLSEPAPKAPASLRARQPVTSYVPLAELGVAQ